MNKLKEKIKLKHILLMIAIALGIIFTSSDSYAATAFSSMINMLNDANTYYYNYDVSANINSTWTTDDYVDWGLLSCVDHYTYVRRSYWDMVGGFDINLNNDNKMYMYTINGTKVEITDEAAKLWLWTTAYYADQVRQKGAYIGDNPTLQVHNVDATLYQALNNITIEAPSVAKFKAIIDGDSYNPPNFSYDYVGKYKARLIIFQGGGTQDLMAIRGDPLEDVWLQIRKKDDTGTSNLAGAQFRIFDIARQQWLSTSGTYTTQDAADGIFETNSEGLTPKVTTLIGVYVALEIKAPDGYIPLGKTVDVYLNTETVVNNDPYYKVTVTKVDGDGNPLEGAAFFFKQIGNNGYTSFLYYDVVTSKATIASYPTSDTAAVAQAEQNIINLYNMYPDQYLFKTTSTGKRIRTIKTLQTGGTWYAKELEAPDGYEMTNEDWQPMTKSGRDWYITVKNEKIVKGKIKIRKTDTEGNILDGAKFDLYKLNSDGTRILPPLYTNLETTNGEVIVSDLEDANYEIVETQAPKGYIISTESKEISVSEAKRNRTVTFKNEKDLIPGKIQIIKVDENGTTGKSDFDGIKFYIYNLDANEQRGSLADTLTIQNGVATSKQLELGKYEIVEDADIAEEKGYKTAASVKVNLSEPGATIQQTIRNSKEDTGNIKIIKNDKDGKKLSGAKFKLERIDSNNNVLDTIETNEMVSGEITISSLKLGTYRITETKAPEGYVLNSTPIIKNITANGQTIEIVVENEKQPLSFTIIKAEQDTGSKIKGAKFKFKNALNEWLGENNTLTTQDKAKEFETDANGQINLVNIPNAEWYAVETYAPQGYKILNTNGIQLNNDGKTNTTTIYNQKIIDLQIKKVDSKNANVTIPGAKFIFKNTTKGLWLYKDAAGDYQLTSDKSKALVATTDSQGLITIKGLPNGEYEATEVEAPAGYKILSESVKLQKNQTTVITNTKQCVDIGGTVFVDGQQGKTSTLNNVYDDGEGVNGLRVILKLNGQEISSVSSGYSSNGTKCEKDGQYKFDGEQLRIDREHLSEYTVEFMYNGMKYESIAKTTTESGNGSKAKESTSDRQAFNTKYTTVTADTKIANGQSTNKAAEGNIIRYKSENYTSKIIYQTTAKDDNGKPYDNTLYADDQYHITSSTKEAGLDLGTPNKQGGYPFDPTKDEIVDINFGVYEREDPDMAITSDLFAAETAINGYSEIYQYGKRYGQIEDGSAYTVTVKASDVKYNQPYERKLYKTDVEYTTETDDGSELAVYLTYSVTIKNQSSSINVMVKDLVNYFNKDFSDGIIEAGTGAVLGEVATMKNNNAFVVTNIDGIEVSEVSEDSGYSKQYITLNKEIEAGSKFQFLIQYKMKKEAIVKVLQGGISFNNIVEINTCSAEHKDGRVWTAVDMDSAVGNCIPNNKATLEDDTDYAPAINILLDTENEREISGIVFEDSTDKEFNTNELRNGNGTYDSGEKGIENVTVQLIDIDRGTIAYSDNDGTNIVSGSQGNYALHGFIPGNYIIKFTYGKDAEKYTAQQYKSTIYVDQARANMNYANGYINASGYKNGYSAGNKYWYLVDTNERKSDAIDNYNGEMQTLYKINDDLVNKTRMEIDSIWN